MYVSSTLQEPLVGFSSRRHFLISSGAYRCTPAEQRSESYPMEMSCTKLYLVVEPGSAGYVVHQDEFL